MLRKAARKEQSASQEDARALHAKALPTAVSPVTPWGDVWFEGSPENVSGDTHCQAVWARHGSRVPGAGRTADGALSPHNTAQDRELPVPPWLTLTGGTRTPHQGLPSPVYACGRRGALTALWNPHCWFLCGYCRAGAAVTGELHEVIDDGLLVHRARWHAWAAVCEKLWQLAVLQVIQNLFQVIQLTAWLQKRTHKPQYRSLLTCFGQVSRPSGLWCVWQQAWCGGSSQTCWKGTGQTS